MTSLFALQSALLACVCGNSGVEKKYMHALKLQIQAF
jgi:hypothetical protein